MLKIKNDCEEFQKHLFWLGEWSFKTGTECGGQFLGLLRWPYYTTDPQSALAASLLLAVIQYVDYYL